MNTATTDSTAKFVSKAYFGIVFMCIISEVFSLKQMLSVFKPMLIPTILVLYLLTSSKNNWVYISSLFFALSSNVFLLFSTPVFLLYGNLAILLFFILAIMLVLKRIEKFLLLPFIIATLPFLFIFSSLLNLTMTTESPSFIPSAINGLLLSVLAGLSLSAYVMNDSKANSWLAISTLLFIVLAFLFMIQKYYLANIAFQPISALVFSFAHYAFYKFVIESESTTSHATIT